MVRIAYIKKKEGIFNIIILKALRVFFSENAYNNNYHFIYCENVDTILHTLSNSILQIYCLFLSLVPFSLLWLSLCLSEKAKRNRGRSMREASCKEYAVSIPSHWAISNNLTNGMHGIRLLISSSVFT